MIKLTIFMQLIQKWFMIEIENPIGHKKKRNKEQLDILSRENTAL